MHLKLLVEALLFASPEPLASRQLLALLKDEGVKRAELEAVLAELQADYQDRALELVHVASGWRFQVRREFSTWVNRLFPEKIGRPSRALLETLAIIAYRQPITRGEIEAIRGVSVNSSIVNTLKELGWIRIVGHKEVPGRPELLATTERFLNDFNLNSLRQLPPIAADEEQSAGQ